MKSSELKDDSDVELIQVDNHTHIVLLNTNNSINGLHFHTDSQRQHLKAVAFNSM